MKLLKRYRAVVGVVAALVLCGVIYFFVSPPAAIPDVTFASWVCDDAGILSAETEELLWEKNRQLSEDYHSIVAVLTVKHLRHRNSDKFAEKVFDKWGLGSADFLLLLDESTMEYLYYGKYYSEDTFDVEAILAPKADAHFFEGDYDGAVTESLSAMESFFAAEKATYESNGWVYYSDEMANKGGMAHKGSPLPFVVAVIVFALVFLLVAVAVLGDAFSILGDAAGMLFSRDHRRGRRTAARRRRDSGSLSESRRSSAPRRTTSSSLGGRQRKRR